MSKKEKRASRAKASARVKTKAKSADPLAQKQVPQDQYIPAQIIAALAASAGIISLAAQKLRCSRTTIYSYIERFPEVAEAAKEIEEEMLDLAESQVLKGLRDGDKTYVIWFLKTKGKHRGWSERFELTTPPGKPMAISFDWSTMPTDMLAKLYDAVPAEQRPK